MVILNYSQFAKKTLIVGVDRIYFVLLLLLFACLSVVLPNTVAVFLIVLAYFYSVYLFYKNAYWFDKLLISLLLKKYKTVNKIIIGR